MALTLNLLNFTPNNCLEQAQVAADASKGQPIVKVDNPQNISQLDYVLIGKPGGGISKIYQVSSVTDDMVTLTENLAFYTERGTAVTKLFGNKINVYAAPYVAGTIPTDSAFACITTTAVDIDPDQLTTSYTHVSGSDQYWYKYTFYNSSNLSETGLESSTAGRDTTGTDYTTVDQVRREAGFENNKNVTNELIYRKLQAAQSKINGMLSGRYILPLGQPVNPIMADLTVRLAAGYTMIAEYGAFDGQDKSKGEKLRDDAIAELTAYQDGSQIITDLQAASTELPNAGGFESSYSSDNPLGFSRDDIVGYNERIY